MYLKDLFVIVSSRYMMTSDQFPILIKRFVKTYIFMSFSLNEMKRFPMQQCSLTGVFCVTEKFKFSKRNLFIFNPLLLCIVNGAVPLLELCVSYRLSEIILNLPSYDL